MTEMRLRIRACGAEPAFLDGPIGSFRPLRGHLANHRRGWRYAAATTLSRPVRFAR